MTIQHLNLVEDFSFPSESFDVVYAHMSLHYFDHETTTKIFEEIARVLKPGGVLAFLVNSMRDPEVAKREPIAEGLYKIDGMDKRYFTVAMARAFARRFDAMVCDDFGQRYSDIEIGVNRLVRFVGTKGCCVL